MARRDDSWLSLTPEPERLLPEARARLRSGGAPPPSGLVAAERRVAEQLIIRARRGRWEAWLRDSVALADRAARHDATAATVALVHDVVANHDALTLGLPGERPDRKR